MRYLLQLILAVFVFEGCNSQPGTSKNQAAPNPASSDSAKLASVREHKEDSLINDYSLFLAGMKPLNSSNIPARILNNNFNKKYRAEMDSDFLKIENNRLRLMRDWAQTELKTEHEAPTTLFYPFSGPDILHALAFYPNETQYVMIAMERPGDIPDLKKMDSAQAAYYLNSVYQSLQDIFQKSYFITHKMLEELQKVKVNGVMPLLCVFLERTGHPVAGIRKKHLNDDGSIRELAADSSTNNLNDFIEIYFHSPGSDTLRKIIYFRANLEDNAFAGLPSFKANKALQNYLNKLPDFYTYTKSASYLMNYGTFSLIRNICLSKSKSILQDDTGIGYKYFDQKVWNVKLYGHYVRPVRDFKWVYDTDLANAYVKDSSNVKPLKFSLGYHWGNQSNQNLMKAERR